MVTGSHAKTEEGPEYKGQVRSAIAMQVSNDESRVPDCKDQVQRAYGTVFENRYGHDDLPHRIQAEDDSFGANRVPEVIGQLLPDAVNAVDPCNMLIHGADQEQAPQILQHIPLEVAKPHGKLSFPQLLAVVCIVLLFASTAIAVSLAFVLSRDQAPAQDGGPSPPPNTLLWNLSAKELEVRSQVSQHFGADSVASIDDDENSPQSNAIKWLATLPSPSQDNATEVSTVQNGTRFKQRYALAVFAFTTNVFQWETSTHWLSITIHECHWHAIECDEFQRVVSVKFTSNLMAGYLPNEIVGLTYLWQFYVTDNPAISGTIPTALAAIEPLQRLRLRNLDLSGSIPDEFNRKFNLDFLYLNGNQLTGTIPAQLGSLQRLAYLYLYDNDLIGTLPMNLLESTSLLELSVRNNDLTGTLEPSIEFAGALQRLNLAGNRFEGKLPESLAIKTNLKHLTLSDNMGLTGSIPTTFGNLKEIETLDLRMTTISGSVPDSLCLLRSMRNVTSPITGREQVSQLTMLAVDCLTNSAIECTCCTACS